MKQSWPRRWSEAEPRYAYRPISDRCSVLVSSRFQAIERIRAVAGFNLPARTSRPSAAANRAMASRWASITKPLLDCLPQRMAAAMQYSPSCRPAANP